MTVLVLAMLPCMAIAVFGQVDSVQAATRWMSIGAVLSGGASFEYGSIVVPEISECDTLRRGSALSWHASMLAELPLATRLSLQLRLGAYLDRGELRERASRPLALAGDNGERIDGLYDHVFAFTRASYAGSLVARFGATDRLELAAGVEAVRHIVDQTFQQEAIAPSSLLFRRQRIVEIRSGVIIPSSPVSLSALASAGYRLPLSSRAWIVPEMSVSIALSSMSESSAWRRVRAAAGATLRFDFHRTPQPPPAIDTPVVAVPPPLDPSITTQPPVVEVLVDEYDSTEALPLLNQIFFAEGTDTIPSRYHLLDDTSVASFTEARLVGSALDVYYDLLNVVALRMKAIPDATLSIEGFRNGREPAGALSRRRAEQIRRYLIDTWDIPAARLRVAGRALPENPARETFEEGFEENARAHLEPSDPNVTAPVIRLHVQRVATPPGIVFYPRANAGARVRSWRLDVLRDSALWRRFEGAGEPPDSIAWDWRSNESDLPSIPMQLGYEFIVSDTTGQTAATPLRPIHVQYRSQSQRLENRQNDTVIESYSLLLFNYDSPSVSADDQELLRAIAAGIKPGAQIRITGYTDSLGLESHNRELAFRRATETARILRELVPDETSISVNPNGGERERFPFDTPEGRSHCRTVIIEVRTPTRESR